MRLSPLGVSLSAFGLAGHALTHRPQPMHASWLNTGILPLGMMALGTGHTSDMLSTLLLTLREGAREGVHMTEPNFISSGSIHVNAPVGQDLTHGSFSSHLP